MGTINNSQLEKQTTYEVFANALFVSLQSKYPEGAWPNEQAIQKAVQVDMGPSKTVSAFKALAGEALQRLLKRSDVHVDTKSLKLSKFGANEQRKYERGAPKLNPSYHMKSQKKHEERLEKEKQYEMKKAMDPRLQQELGSVLTMKPVGV